MVKAYLRYELSGTFGIITSNSNLVYDITGKYVISASLENISVWNIKQGTLARTLEYPTGSSSGVSEVTSLAVAPHGGQVAAGYADGTVRLWALDSGECSVTLSGHKSAVSVLRYNTEGSVLCSGGKDTDIVLWDVVMEAGLVRLRGHKDQITDVAFVCGGKRMVSSSKDGYLKVWDLDTQHCCQTVIGQNSEVWCLAVSAQQDVLVAGCADPMLRVFEVRSDSEASGSCAHSQDVLVPRGSLRRQTSDRAAALQFVQSQAEAGDQLLYCQGAGKTVEIFRTRSDTEMVKHMKRRKKRKRDKGSKGTSDDVIPATQGEDDDEQWQATDKLVHLQLLVSKHKIRSSDATTAWRQKGVAFQLVLGLTNNSFEVWNMNSGESSRAHLIDLPGHRSDIRAVTLSSDDLLLMSASNNSIKIWNPRTSACLRTMDSGYVLCALFAPGNRHVVAGTKEGMVEIFDTGASALCESIKAHEGAVWTMAALPDGSGFVTGGADHDVKFWEWQVVSEEGGGKKLTCRNTRTLKMSDDVLCVRVTPNGKLLVVALLDATVKVFFLDSLKFFLSLYGHKLPVLCCDVSSDSTLLATGSADKNIRIWGLDYGDCHKSLFAHGDSVMGVSFVRDTHYVFSVGKDKMLKYWDADKFELLLELGGHCGEVWSLAVAGSGEFLVTGSHDRSLRRWERTDEPFFVEEEKEKRLESLFEADLTSGPSGADSQAAALTDDGAAAPASRRTAESLADVDRILEALELAATEAERIAEHEAQNEESTGKPKPLAPNPFLLGLTPSAFVLKAVTDIRAANLEQALLMLPFPDALQLLGYVLTWLQQGMTVELCVRTSALLLRIHQSQLETTPRARPTLLRLHTVMHRRLRGLKDTLGFNVAAMSVIQRMAKERSAGLESETMVPVKRAAPVA